VALDPGDVHRLGIELGHQLEDFQSVMLAWSGSGVASPNDGAG